MTGGSTAKAQVVDVTDRFGRVDLAPLLGEPKEVKTNRSAYVFLELGAAAEQTVTIGFGADWWFQAWLDGRLIQDTMDKGNDTWPPSALDHRTEAKLSPGKHVIAVRFVSGTGSSVLAIGGPETLARGPPPGPLFRNEPEPDGNLLPNRGFEDGAAGEPFLPQGWEMGQGAYAFQAGELAAHETEPISGRRSLEINTPGAGAVKRRILTRFAADLDTVYAVFFKARNLAGDGYITVSVRDSLERPAVEYLGAVAESTYPYAIRRHQTGKDVGYVYFEQPDLHLVIEAQGAIHALLDDVCVAPAEAGKQWISSEQHRAPWPHADEWSALSRDVVTPHVPWLRPRAGNRLRIISMMPRPRHRRTVELAQRLDLDAVPIFFEAVSSVRSEIGSDYWGYDGDSDPRLIRVEALARERLASAADGILISELGPGMVPAALAEQVLARVAAGTGLVIAVLSPYGSIDIATFAKEAPWNGAIKAENQTTAETDYVQLGTTSVHPIANLGAFYAYGKGRIALLAEFTQDGNRASYEADMPYLIKAMLWATHQLPDVRIGTVALPGKSTGPLRFALPQSALPAAASLTLTAQGAMPPGLALRCWVEDFQNDPPRGEQEMPLGAEQREVRIEVPFLPAGEHRLHCRLLRDGKGMDWASVLLEVQAPLTITALARATDKPYQVAGEPIAGQIKLSAPLGDGQRATVSLWDADGRLWRQAELAGPGPVLDFTLSSPPSVVLWHRLEAQVVGPAGVVAARQEEFAVVRPAVDDAAFFDYQMWCIPNHAMAIQTLRMQGVTSGGYVDGNVFMARDNIRPLPAVGYHWEGPPVKPGSFYPYHQTRIVGSKQAPERSPCLNAAEFRKQMAEKMGKDVAAQCRFAPIGYGLAHEWNLLGQYGAETGADICFAPECVQDLRAFLRGEYGTVAALNTGWGTAFRDWEDVTPLVLRDALQAKQISRWIDHRRHMDRVTTDYLKQKNAVVRRLDPMASGAGDNFRVGDTLLDSYSGVDYWLLLHEAVTWGGNPPPYLLAFTPPERRPLMIQRDAAWHPGVFTTDEALLGVRLDNQPWQSLLMGHCGFGFFPGSFFGPPSSAYHPWLQADLRPGVVSQFGPAAMARIRSGISRLVHESTPDFSGIAFLYSRSSEHAATAWQALHPQGPAQRLHPPAQVGSFRTALEELGYGYEALAEAQLADDALRKHGCRLLILPFSQALPVAAADRVREFVKTGGTVLADVRPAVADQHGRTGARGLLDDVFGVRHDPDFAAYEPTEGPVDLHGRAAGLKLNLHIAGAIAGPELQLAGATALGSCAGRPVFLVHRYGRGMAILMNCALPDRADAHETLRTLLTWRDVHPLFAVSLPEAVRAPANQAAGVAPAGERLADAEGFSAGRAAGGSVQPRLAVFRHGRIQCFAFWFEPHRLGNRTGQFTITPPAAGHAYDLRTGAYLGRVKDRFTVSAPLEALQAYAVTPYRIEPPTVQAQVVPAPDGIRLLQCVAQAQPRAARREHPVVHFQLFGPDGTEWRDFAASVTASEGNAEHAFALPLNAPAGRWRIVASEAISSLAGVADVVLPR